jgi:hypothetical protein
MKRKINSPKFTAELFRDRSRGAVVCTIPPQVSAGWRIGQRVYFSARRGEIHVTPRPLRSSKGRIYSSRLRRKSVPVRQRHEVRGLRPTPVEGVYP